MTHEFKIHPEPFSDYFLRRKSFEIRKNDRDYKFKDLLILKEYNPKSKMITGNKIAREVREIYTDLPGLKEGYVLLQLREPLYNPFYKPEI